MSFPSIYQYDYTSSHGDSFAKSACFACCYLAVAQNDDHNIDMDTLIDSGDVNKSNGYVNKFSYLGVGSYVVSTSIPLSTLKAEVDKGRPVFIRVKNTSGGTHFFVVYDYANSGTSSSDFQVMDPGYSPQETTLDIAANRGSKKFDAIRKTTKKTVK